MYRIAKTYNFAASHQLPLGPDHKCSRMHGHTYSVTFEFQRTEFDGIWVRDFDLEVADWIRVTLDHRHLNDLKQLSNPHTQSRGAKPGDGGMDQREQIIPTAENLAKWIYDQWGGPTGVWSDLVSVRVAESPTSWAEYRA